MSTALHAQVYRVQGASPKGMGFGTCFCIENNPATGSKFVTNWHVVKQVEDANMELVIWLHGRTVPVEATATYSNGGEIDLALLEGPYQSELKAVSKIEDQSEPGDRLHITGHPLGQSFSTSYGAVYVNSTTINIMDTETLPGVSGSPVFNEDNAVVGVVYAYTPNTGITYMVPAQALIQFLEGRTVVLSQYPTYNSLPRVSVTEEVVNGLTEVIRRRDETIAHLEQTQRPGQPVELVPLILDDLGIVLCLCLSACLLCGIGFCIGRLTANRC